jgi:hypothetical protein
MRLELRIAPGRCLARRLQGAVRATGTAGRRLDHRLSGPDGRNAIARRRLGGGPSAGAGRGHADRDRRQPLRSDPDEQAKAFASFVKKHPPTTDYALLGSYLGTPGKSVDEVRAVLADGSGAVVWRDRQGKQDAAFKKDTPRNPMTCSVFLVKRLCEPLHLQDPLRADAPRGKLEARYRARTGVPTPATFDAMKARQKQLRDAAPGATVVVYPVRVGGKLSKSDAEALVEMINAAGLFKAVLAETSVPFEVQQSVNQQRVLWSGAHSIQKQLRKNAPPADYALVADYLISGAGRPARGVHLFLCNRAGEFVVVDFQNSHHADYNRIKPRSSKDCTRLALD